MPPVHSSSSNAPGAHARPSWPSLLVHALPAATGPIGLAAWVVLAVGAAASGGSADAAAASAGESGAASGTGALLAVLQAKVAKVANVSRGSPRSARRIAKSYHEWVRRAWSHRPGVFDVLGPLALAGGLLGCGPSTSESPDGALGDASQTEASPRGNEGGSSSPEGGSPSADAGGSADAPSAVDSGGVGDGRAPAGRPFPDTNASIALLVDQLPTMNASQMQFAATHYVGTEKQLLPVTQALRAINPAFLVLHYHLAMWQSAPATDFIVDGTSWGNDYPTVTNNETWFWHDASNARVTSSADQKLLMNVSVSGFQQYWAQSLATQVADGQYDGIMLDSASPALLQGECGGTGAGQDPRLATTAARDTTFPELGGVSWITAWQSWMTSLASALAAKGIPLIPNTSAFTTGWDDTDYTLTPGAFVEGFAGTSFALSDWQASTNELLELVGLDRTVILQNYLASSGDVPTRMYYLGNYLLVRGHHTYLDYFANGPLEWYPEWGIDLGAPTGPAATDVSTMAVAGGGYRRDFANGSVVVNPTGAAIDFTIAGMQVTPTGGGAVPTSGLAPGGLSMTAVTSVSVPAHSAAVVLH